MSGEEKFFCFLFFSFFTLGQRGGEEQTGVVSRGHGEVLDGTLRGEIFPV